MKEKLQELGVDIVHEVVDIYGPCQLFVASGVALSMAFIGFTTTIYLFNRRRI